jgi:hypothetical protein
VDRFTRWLLPLLIVAEIGVVRSGLIDLGSAIGIAVAVEGLLLLVASRNIVIAARRYRQNRGVGLDGWSALEDGLTAFFPRPIARLVALEPRIWSYLWIWLFRRRKTGVDEFPYRKRSYVITYLLLVVVSTPVEIFAFEVLLPWAWLRAVLLILGIYTFVWIFAFNASLSVLPHRLRATGLDLHYGFVAGGHIPYPAIERVILERRRPKDGEGLRVVKGENTAYLAVGGRTDLTLVLREPLRLEGLLARTEPVTTICVAADDPQKLYDALASAIPSPSVPGVSPRTVESSASS